MKKKMGSTLAVYPLPVAVVGSEQNGRINYNAIAHVGIMDFQTVSLSMGKMHYSNQGIKENKTLSINLTSMEMFDKMTYVGSVSGADADKSQVFESEYGELKGAPMIKEAPVSMECEVIDIYDRPEFDVFIVKIVNTYVREDVLTDGKIDYAKVMPVLDAPLSGYFQLGEEIKVKKENGE